MTATTTPSFTPRAGPTLGVIDGVIVEGALHLFKINYFVHYSVRLREKKWYSNYDIDNIE